MVTIETDKTVESFNHAGDIEPMTKPGAGRVGCVAGRIRSTERPDFFRMAVYYAGARTSISMDYALFDLLVLALNGNESVARGWIKDKAASLPVIPARIPSLSRRIQVSVLNVLMDRLSRIQATGDSDDSCPANSLPTRFGDEAPLPVLNDDESTTNGIVMPMTASEPALDDLPFDAGPG